MKVDSASLIVENSVTGSKLTLSLCEHPLSVASLNMNAPVSTLFFFYTNTSGFLFNLSVSDRFSCFSSGARELNVWGWEYFSLQFKVKRKHQTCELVAWLLKIHVQTQSFMHRGKRLRGSWRRRALCDLPTRKEWGETFKFTHRPHRLSAVIPHESSDCRFPIRRQSRSSLIKLPQLTTHRCTGAVWLCH